MSSFPAAPPSGARWDPESSLVGTCAELNVPGWGDARYARAPPPRTVPTFLLVFTALGDVPTFLGTPKTNSGHMPRFLGTCAQISGHMSALTKGSPRRGNPADLEGRPEPAGLRFCLSLSTDLRSGVARTQINEKYFRQVAHSENGKPPTPSTNPRHPSAHPQQKHDEACLETSPAHSPGPAEQTSGSALGDQERTAASRPSTPQPEPPNHKPTRLPHTPSPHSRYPNRPHRNNPHDN